MRNWQQWSEEEDQTIKAKAATMSSAEIGRLLNRTSDSVKHRAQRIGVSLRKYGEACPGAKYSNATVDRARDLHEAGVMPKEISKQLGIPYWNICDFVYYKRGLGYGYET